MNGIKDWILSQLVSKSLVSSSPSSGSDNFFTEEHLNDDLSNQAGVIQAENPLSPPLPFGVSRSSENNQVSVVLDEDSNQLYQTNDEDSLHPLAKIQHLQVKFLRLIQRFGLSQDNLLVAKVLYRIHLTTLVRSGNETDLKRAILPIGKARAVAAEQEATGVPELDFSIRILVIGKTGVGKSAFINSIFDQTKVETNAFRPATDRIREITGIVNGIKMNVIDTPGLLPSSTNSVRRNRKILFSVKRYTRKYPPDFVLYFDRLDFINSGYSDFPLLKLVTDVFGSAIWFNTILVMTHSSSVLPEGSGGYPVNYESFVSKCTELVQHCIHQVVSDSRLENPVLLVENHHECRTNVMGEKILPNGQCWKSQFLLLSLCTKVLGDTNTLLNFQDSIELGPASGTRIPSIPHLLSSLLRHRSVSRPGSINTGSDDILISDLEEEEEKEDGDEYDRLPPIRILTKSQFGKLTKSQKNEYLDELDYRETLYLKKQLKEELLRRRENKLSNVNNSENQDESPEAVQLPDMAVPINFDSDCPVHRYRCLVTSDKWLARPVLDPQGWDHDVGFDGINLETSMEIKNNLFTSITGQISKDKQDFSIQSDCSTTHFDPSGTSYLLGLSVQSSGKDLMYTINSNVKLKNVKNNTPECEVSLTSFNNKCYVGAKLEDTISVGKRVKFVINAGRMGGLEQAEAAYGGTLEATLRGIDYPVRNDFLSLTMTVLSFNKETVLTGGFQTEFRPIRGMRMSVDANLNNRKMGQIRIKTSSSEHLEIALIALFSIVKGVLRKKIEANG